MRRILNLGLLVLIITTMTACSGSSDSVGSTAKKYAEYLANGQYEKYIDILDIPEEIDTKELKEQKKQFIAMLEEMGKMAIEHRGKVKEINVLSENVSEDGNSATVILEFIYDKEEDREEETLTLVKRSGTWKISIG